MINPEPREIRKGIVFFEGKIARHLMLDKTVSHSYFLEDGDEVIVFDPSCGKEIAGLLEAHIRERHEVSGGWKKGLVIAGHSHFDHANNFYLSDVIGARETRIYVHERGFDNGQVMNEPAAFIRKEIREIKSYYNPYLSFFAPYDLMIYPFAALDVIWPNLAAKLFGWIGSIRFPSPVDGSIRPEPLTEEDTELVEFGELSIKGWSFGDKIVFPTPGHSPCSVSLFWPEKKALFISDADWIGNPVFMDSSLKDCISSLKKITELARAGLVDLLLPAHGIIRAGIEEILSHLEFHIRRLEVMRSDILSTFRHYGEERDVRKLTKILVRESVLFRMLRMSNYPRFVVFVPNIVALCLKEEGILPK